MSPGPAILRPRTAQTRQEAKLFGGRAWHERYEVEGLIRQYGADAKLPDQLPLVRKLTALLADCPKWRVVSIYDRCKAVSERA